MSDHLTDCPGCCREVDVDELCEHRDPLCPTCCGRERHDDMTLRPWEVA